MQETDNVTKICETFSPIAEYSESLSALINDAVAKLGSVGRPQKNYYNITDLVNPAQRFWKEKVKVDRPKELTRKFLRGKQLQGFASLWIRELPDFFAEEATLDGAYVGIPRVRGRIDYRIGETILELKTKEKIPETPAEIISKYPQDIEQVLFYAAIHPNKPTENHLLFMQNSEPFEQRIFKLTIKDIAQVKQLLLDRITALDNAIKTNDPSKLGRCRYYETLCEYREAKACDCEKLQPLDTKKIEKLFTIGYDENFSKEIEVIKEANITKQNDGYFIRNILAPRRSFYEDSWSGTDEYWNFMPCLDKAINQLKYYPAQSEKEKIKQLNQTRVITPFKWLKVLSSKKENGEILPYVRKVTSAQKLRKPHSHYLAELGVLCATHNQNKGLVITMYPKRNKFTTVYEVRYNEIKEFRRFINEQVELIDSFKKNGEINALPKCPDFYCETCDISECEDKA